MIALDGRRVGEGKRDVKIDWVRREPQPSRNETKFVDVDNPG